MSIFLALHVGCGGRVDETSPYNTDDLGDFLWSWSTLGGGERVELRRDCTLTAKIGFATPRTAVVGASDCERLKSLVVSRAVLDALASDVSCGNGTDDYATFRLELVDGTVLERATEGCSHVEPFGTVQGELRRLSDKFAPPIYDAGSDAPSE
jgi:hypothetical protein